MSTVRVSETFSSIQGESTFAGMPCFFVRLAGCNLRCRYCDTPYAREGGEERRVEELARMADDSGLPSAAVTGGEPLLQPGFPALASALCARAGRTVLVETNGSRDLSLVPARAVSIVDVKSPGSGECGSFDARNIERLRPCDEVKFVLTDRVDYEWAVAFTREHGLPARCRAVLFSPAYGRADPAELARWVLEDRLPVRVQPQLHRWIGVR